MPNDPDSQLDDLFASARQLSARDLSAAERVLPRLRAATERQHRAVLRTWMSALLASAAMLGTFVYVRQDTALPTSAAYDSYTSITGEGW